MTEPPNSRGGARTALIAAGLVAIAAVAALLATLLVTLSDDDDRIEEPAPALSLPERPLPPGWPARLELGIANALGDGGRMSTTADFGFRYQYLSGGVDRGWLDWLGDGSGEFVTRYIEESIDVGVTPIFSYYMTLQSSPLRGPEDEANFATLRDADTMRAYFEQLAIFFDHAGAFPDTTIVLHVEPDLWGYAHRGSRDGDPSTIAVAVGSTGLPALSGLPDDLTGFAHAFERLRDRQAPNVLLAYSLSTWGVGRDILYEDPPDREVDELAARSAEWYRALGVEFDLTFAEFTDRDAGFDEVVRGDGGASWWDPPDFDRHVRFLDGFGAGTGQRIVLWQVPYGNTRFRALDNSWNHFQDNKVEWLLDDDDRDHLRAYVEAGVIAFLFGRGAEGATDASDAARDGTTNPAPVNGNSRLSLSADDDGGFFRLKAREYYEAGPIPLR